MPLEFRYDNLIVIRVEAAEEPLFRQFFTQVAHACGRPVAG